MAQVIEDYTNHLKLDKEPLFSTKKRVLYTGHNLHTQKVNQGQIK